MPATQIGKTSIYLAIVMIGSFSMIFLTSMLDTESATGTMILVVIFIAAVLLTLITSFISFFKEQAWKKTLPIVSFVLSLLAILFIVFLILLFSNFAP